MHSSTYIHIYVQNWYRHFHILPHELICNISNDTLDRPIQFRYPVILHHPASVDFSKFFDHLSPLLRLPSSSLTNVFCPSVRHLPPAFISSYLIRTSPAAYVPVRTFPQVLTLPTVCFEFNSNFESVEKTEGLNVI